MNEYFLLSFNSKRPKFSGLNPSTSFSKAILSITFFSSIWEGRGSWTKIPFISSFYLIHL